MISQLLDYVRSMFHTIKRNDVIKSLELTLANIDDTVIPSLSELIDNSDLAAINKNVFLANVGKVSGIKAKDNKEVLTQYKQFFTTVSKNQKQLVKLVELNLSEVITDKTVTAKEAAILRLVNDLFAMSSYLMDLVYFVMIDEKTTEFPKVKLKRTRDLAADFASNYRAYSNNFVKFIADLESVSNDPINVQAKESMLGVQIAKNGKLVDIPTVKGFVGNPIYHIRMHLVDRDAKQHEALKIKKKLIELKVIELKQKATQEGTSTSLTKQIEYYENKLVDIEHKLEKLAA